MDGKYKHAKAKLELLMRKLPPIERKRGESHIALVQAAETLTEAAISSIGLPLLEENVQMLDKTGIAWPPQILAHILRRRMEPLWEEAAAGNADASRKIADMMRPWRKGSSPTKPSVSYFSFAQLDLPEHEQRAHFMAEMFNEHLCKLIEEGAPKLDVVLKFVGIAEQAWAMPDDEVVVTYLMARMMSQGSTAFKALRFCGNGCLSEDFDPDTFESV